MNMPLSGWIVTEHKERPRFYLARSVVNNEKTGAVIAHATLTGLRNRLPPGLRRVPVPPTYQDIIEIWN